LIQAPKTPAAIREVDLTAAVVELLKEFLDKRTSGLLFRTENLKPWAQSNISRRNLHPLLSKLGISKRSFHGMRRFRTTWLRKNDAPEDLTRLWLGHSNKSITDLYSKVRDDRKFRQEQVEKLGIGFKVISLSVSSVSKSGVKNETSESEK
jgi:integrase